MIDVLRFDRSDQQRDDGLSTTLQIGKAAEHIACAELILQGYNSFLAEAGLPYDILVDRHDGTFWRMQVKSTCNMMPERTILRAGRKPARGRSVYRFALRRSRTGERRISLAGCDFLALVALDIRKVAWMSVSDVLTADGHAIYAIDFKSRNVTYVRSATGVDPNKCGRFIEDFLIFKPSVQSGECE